MGAGMDGAAEAGLQRATHTLQQERRLRRGVSAAPALPMTAWEVMGGDVGPPSWGQHKEDSCLQILDSTKDAGQVVGDDRTLPDVWKKVYTVTVCIS